MTEKAKQLGEEAACSQAGFLDTEGMVSVASHHLHNSMGITKREYFAGLAMQGLLSNPDTYLKLTLISSKNNETISQIVAGLAIKNADSLLEGLIGAE